MAEAPAAWFWLEYSIEGRVYAERIDDNDIRSAMRNHATSKNGMWVQDGWRASVSPLYTKDGIKAAGHAIHQGPPVNPDDIRRMLATVRA